MTLTEVEMDQNALQISELKDLTGSKVCSCNCPLQVADGEADASGASVINHLLGGVTWSHLERDAYASSLVVHRVLGTPTRG